MAPGKHKQEYPPLLPQGFHQLSVDELRELCVTGFPESAIRADIMAGFETVYESALAVGIEGEAWIDGSFLTKKMEPGDIDFVFLMDANFLDNGTPAQQEFIEWLISNDNDPRKSFLCHTDVVLVYPPDSPLHAITVNTKRHWEANVYGFSVSTHEPKGIVVVGLQPAKPSEEAEVPK